MSFRADLHCHSIYSDGTLSPKELVILAKEKNLQGLSITDHDTIDAYDEDLFSFAENKGILLGTGVEFSCAHKETNVHILGYNYSLSAQSLKDFCNRHQIRRKNRNLALLDKLKQRKMYIKEEELYRAERPFPRVVGRPHIAELMVKKGYVRTIKEAFSRYIGDGKPCYVRGESFSVEETIEVIHLANGKAFIAHPHLMHHDNVFREILEMNFDGVECYYAMFAFAKEERWIKIAKEKGWLISGGSDFHGEIKPQIPLGCSWVDQNTFERIFTP